MSVYIQVVQVVADRVIIIGQPVVYMNINEQDLKKSIDVYNLSWSFCKRKAIELKTKEREMTTKVREWL